MTTRITTMLTQPDDARRFLLPFVRRGYPGVTGIGRLAVRPLGSVQVGRGVFRIRLTSQGRRPRRLELFASVDAHGGSKRIFAMLQRLDRHGFGRGHLRAPRPLGYSQAHQTLVYESFAGTRLRDQIELGKISERALASCMRQSADWLRRFHALPVPSGPQRSPTLGLRDFSRLSTPYRRLLSLALPIMNRSLLASHARPSLVHGDPHLANCIRGTGGSFAFIDYSESYVGNPLADVAMFLVHLDVALQPYYSRRAIRTLQTTFLDRYFRRRLVAATRRVLIGYQVRSAVQFLAFTADHHRHPRGYVGWILRRLEQLIAAGTRQLSAPEPVPPLAT